MEEGGDQIKGAEGLASVAGFKAMLAKARGENTDQNQTAEGADAANGKTGAEAGKNGQGKPTDKGATVKKPSEKQPEQKSHLDKIFEAAEKFKDKNKEKKPPAPKKTEESTGAEVGPDGLRIVSLESIRKEIWLNHGAIPMKRLMKLFDIKKKSSPERQNKFREVVKELCTMKTDPVGGRMLVLKQHYSNMG
jgi:hypothetical protein